MKKLHIIIIVLLLSASSYAQKNILVTNDQGKLMYYHVGNIPAADSLQRLAVAQAFLKKYYPDIKPDKDQPVNGSSLNAKGKFTLYSKGLIAGQEDGLLQFDLTIAFKETKYRVMATNLTYLPLQRNRYGLFTPVAGISYTLEELSKKVKESQYENYSKQITTFFSYLDQQLYNYLNHTDAKPAKPLESKHVSTKDW
ncbi:hypothetical protein [Mucilaginibacter sp. CSA2-8R]|uniref:hypothetical protein n=1 Tax=Mucilaginibacter sp. CSA2-8R TaxID=3141542 RepID=UPI00315C8945